MIRKANQQSESPKSSSQWQLLIRHPLLLKVVTWLSSLSLMASSSVSWAEIKPIEVTAQSANANFFQGPALPVTGAGNSLPVALSATDVAATQTHRELHNGLLGSSNFMVGMAAPSTLPKRSYQSKSGVPLAMQVPTATGCNGVSRQLVSSICSKASKKLQPTTQSRIATTAAYQTKASPVVTPLPVVQPKAAQRLPKLVSNTRPLVQPQLRLAKPQAIASVPGSLPIYVAPPRTTEIPEITQIPKVSRPQTPNVAPLPTVQTARVTSGMPTAIAAANYQINADFIYPLATPMPVTSSFGWRTHPITGNRRFHAGMDFGAPTGTPIVAVAPGRVVLANWHGGYGKTVIIEHTNGQLQTLYAHMSEIFVQEGQVIPQGTVIGHVGSTGNSTGPHLHFETKVPTADGWVVVDPENEVNYALANLRQAQANQYSRRPGD
jgi:murein DD-endopeptidase MepM/ murein hydrolase activator NlpD